MDIEPTLTLTISQLAAIAGFVGIDHGARARLCALAEHLIGVQQEMTRKEQSGPMEAGVRFRGNL